MTVITTRITAAEDGTISGRLPSGQLPPGEHEATIPMTTAAPLPLRRKPSIMEGFPRRPLRP